MAYPVVHIIKDAPHGKVQSLNVGCPCYSTDVRSTAGIRVIPEIAEGDKELVDISINIQSAQEVMGSCL
ncbi:MAG: hypothetical protein H9W81_03340 [Enterococcus sp.]|nr:hypothetical protein [Enterococcus sp.]